jgi:hypothetical protein
MDEGIPKMIQLPPSSLRKNKIIIYGWNIEIVGYSSQLCTHNYIHKQSYIVIMCLFKPWKLLPFFFM